MGGGSKRISIIKKEANGGSKTIHIYFSISGDLSKVVNRFTAEVVIPRNRVNSYISLTNSA